MQHQTDILQRQIIQLGNITLRIGFGIAVANPIIGPIACIHWIGSTGGREQPECSAVLSLVIVADLALRRVEGVAGVATAAVVPMLLFVDLGGLRGENMWVGDELVLCVERNIGEFVHRGVRVQWIRV